MIFQPTNILPDELNGNGTVDLTDGLQVSWQINGDSPMTGYAVTIQPYGGSTANTFTVENSISPFWGRNSNGDVQRYYVNIPAALLDDYGIVNGSDYALSITQYWTDSNSQQQEVKQLASSVFHARKAPVVSIITIPTVTTTDYTFQATYSQAQGDEINGIRWMLALKDYEDTPLKDTGMIYGTGILKMYYNGLLNDTYYVVRCIVTTEYGAEADTGWTQFRVNYSVGEASNSVAVCQKRKENCVSVSWERYQSATRYLVFRKKKNATRLEHVAEIKSTAVDFELMDYRAKSGETYQYYVFPANATKYLTAAEVTQEIRIAYRYWAIFEAVEYRENVYAVVAAHYFRYGEGGIKEGKISNNNSPSLLQNFTRYPTRQGNSQLYKTGTVTGYVGTLDGLTREYSDTVDQADVIMELSKSNNVLFLSDPKGHFLRIHIKDAISSQTSVTKKIMPQTITVPWVEVGNAEDISLISMLTTTFKVKYNANGGSGAPSSTTFIESSPTHTFTLSTTKPTRSGYTFDRWNEASDGSGKSYLPGGQITLTADEPEITLYAQWISNTTYSFKLKYDERIDVGGETFGELIVESVNTHGTTYTFTVKYGEPYSSQYVVGTFLGWSESSSATIATYVGGDTITLTTSNPTKTLFPVYEDNMQEVTIYQLIYYGNATGVAGVPGAVIESSSDGSCNMGRVSTSIPVRSGYTFVGWNTNQYGYGISYPAGENVTLYEANPTLELYAQWAQAGTTYNLSLIMLGNGGNYSVGGATQTFYEKIYQAQTQYATVQIENSVLPTRAGYTLIGWADNDSAVTATYALGGTITVGPPNASKVIYAVWSENQTTTYSVTYNSNAGTDTVTGMPATNPQTSQNTDLYTPSSGPSRTSSIQGTTYTFVGWSRNSSATSATYGNSALISFPSGTTAITLYAIWSSSTTPSTNTYTLIYHANSGRFPDSNETKTQQDTGTTSYKSVTISSASAYTPTRSGYTFLGWSDSQYASGGTPDYYPGGSVSIAANQGKTIYAVWQQVSGYVLSFNGNGGGYTVQNVPADQTSQTSSLTITSQVPTIVPQGNTYYTFYKWYETAQLGGRSFNPGDTYSFENGATSATLYAGWTQRTYYLSFNKNAGSDTVNNMPSGQSNYTGLFSIPNVTPTRVSSVNYTFLGWALDPSATEPDVTYPNSIQADPGEFTITLYAVWEAPQITYTVTYTHGTGWSGPSNESVTTSASSYTFTIPDEIPEAQSDSTIDKLFLGWDTNLNGVGTRYVPGDTITLYNTDPTIELYAIYENVQYYTYTLHFLPNAGSDSVINMPTAIAQTNPFSGSSYTFTIPSGTSNTPVRYGYASDAFDGWGETAAEDSSVYPHLPGETITVNHNTVYQQFGPVWQQGGINSSGNNKTNISSNEIRTRGYIEFLNSGLGYRDAVTVYLTNGTATIFDYIVTESGGVKSYTYSTSTSVGTTYTFAPQSGHAYRFMYYYSNGILPTNANTYIKICDHKNMLLYAWWDWEWDWEPLLEE